VDGVFVHHHLSASFSQLANGEKARIFEANRVIFERRWGPWRPHHYRPEAGFGDASS
jgi:hypothetical protein